jgi:DUF1680 family protein
VAFAINGKPAVSGEPGSYVSLDRQWAEGDTVSFELPMTPRTVHYTGYDQDDEHERYALLVGPVLMALLGAEDLDMPVADLPGRLRPVEGKPLHFAIDGVPGATYKPYWQVGDGTFTCFPTLR